MKFSFWPILKYSALPGILPRLKDMLESGFGQIAFLLATLYNALNLLPDSHPYTNGNNIGRFGVAQVIHEASKNVIWNKENIDKVIIFLVTLSGMVLLVAQFVILAVAILFTPALAYAQFGLFSTPNPTTDLAFIGMDMVFGVPGVFNSCISVGANCSSDPTDRILQGTGSFPWPFHVALHSLFQLYSVGLLVIAAMIIIYFVITILAETAQTGTPFGKRFNHVWAPIRLTLALGLLVPLGSGLNSAQYITLYAAKMGSSLATNAWIGFNDDLGTSTGSSQNQLLGSQTRLVGKPNPPKAQGFLQFMHIAKTCQLIERHYGRLTLSTNPIVSPGPFPLPIPSPSTNLINYETVPVPIEAWAVRSNQSAPPDGEGCRYNKEDQAIKMYEFASAKCAWYYFDGGDAVFRIGEQDEGINPDEIGYVDKKCGEFIIPMVNPSQPAGEYLSQLYFDSVKDLWYSSSIRDFHDITEEKFVFRNLSIIPQYDPSIEPSKPELRLQWATDFTNQIKGNINAAYDDLLSKIDVIYSQELLEKGWAGAGIWYNKIAEINGLFLDTVTSFPYASKYPEVMEYIAEERQKKNANAAGDRYSNEVAGEAIEFPSKHGGQQEKYDLLYKEVYQWWTTDPITGSGVYGTDELVGHISDSGNPLINTINLIFGTSGLFDMRENADVHPLAQLTNLGKGIMNSTITQILGGLAGIGAQVFGNLIGQPVISQIGQITSSVTFSVASIGLTAGFILYYILPFLPFIYFFFAVIGWIKSIFEAMVGVPLWALAHLRIDGDGLAGDAALGGYFLIFEIALRPILILFGLLASITIFAASVQILNEIFDLVVVNLSGFNEAHSNGAPGFTDIEFYRDPVDQFFYTVIYAVIVYLLGTSSFKLIDLIPKDIFRWAGQSVKAFEDGRGDVAGGLTQYAAIGGSQIFQQGLGGIQKAGEGAAAAAKGLSGEKGLNTAPKP